MNHWAQRTATLHLSETGREIFRSTFGDAVIEVYVEWADEFGLWIFHQHVNEVTASVMLIKWAHFDTAVIDVVLQEPKPAKVLGFKK